MRDLNEILQAITERYRHLWLNRRTGELALTSDPYTLIKGRRKTLEIDVSREGRGHHAQLEVFQKSWVYVCEGWKVRRG